MPVQGAYYNWTWGIGHDTGGSGSLQINFRPSDALALVSLSMADGDGLCHTGIRQYRTRSVPTGPDQDHNFTWTHGFGLPPVARDPIMTSVTAQLTLGARQQGVMTLVVWFI
jgi:hypothetical protein